MMCSLFFCLPSPPSLSPLFRHILEGKNFPICWKGTLFHASRWIISSLGPWAWGTLRSYFHILQLWQLASVTHLWKLKTWKREILVDSTQAQPEGASLSTFLGWLNHWVITQRHPHKCATIKLDLSRISQHFLHLWNFHFQMSQALIQVFFT